MVICLERGADLHMAQLMPLPLTVSCSSKSRLVLPFWCRLTWVFPEKGPLNGCVCVCSSLLDGELRQSSGDPPLPVRSLCWYRCPRPRPPGAARLPRPSTPLRRRARAVETVCRRRSCRPPVVSTQLCCPEWRAWRRATWLSSHG